MLSRREIDERLAFLLMPESQQAAVEDHLIACWKNEIAALETAQQLAEWVEILSDTLKLTDRESLARYDATVDAAASWLEAAKALEGYKQLYADTLGCLEDKCAELAALRAENERLRAFAQWVAAGEPSPAEYDPSADGRDEALSSGNSGDSELYGVLTVYYNMAQKAKAALQGGGSDADS